MSYQDQHHPVGAPPPQGNSQFLFKIFWVFLFLGILLRKDILRLDIHRKDILQQVIPHHRKDTVKDIQRKAILHRNILKVLHHSILIKVLHRRIMVRLHLRRRKTRIQASWKDVWLCSAVAVSWKLAFD
ncbi:predicted protein [Arabidopsis lyrata subsp. lyrata]|uniref:Predicted protein n=1 Tax=Arabidopsis lyrata subsp. lyrata TaxID=81972 RepID=D7LSZ1_ARALL|nr:predicted protein [Arabidopsis lyrata subsp. lyrata]